MRFKLSEAATKYIKHEANTEQLSVEEVTRALALYFLKSSADFYMMEKYGLDVKDILSRIKTLEVSQLDTENIVITTNKIFTEKERNIAILAKASNNLQLFDEEENSRARKNSSVFERYIDEIESCLVYGLSISQTYKKILPKIEKHVSYNGFYRYCKRKGLLAYSKAYSKNEKYDIDFYRSLKSSEYFKLSELEKLLLHINLCDSFNQREKVQ